MSHLTIQSREALKARGGGLLGHAPGVLGASLALLMTACAPSGGSDQPGSGGRSTGSASGGASGTGTGGAVAPGTGGASIGSSGGAVGSGGAPVTGSGGGSVTGSGGAATGGSASTGGAPTGATGGAGAAGRGGTAGSSAPASGGATGAGSGGASTPGAFPRPEGKIPNSPQPASVVGLPKADWKKGMISPTMQMNHQINQPTVINGHLVIGGNEEFWIYDVSAPATPKLLSSFTTPSRTGAEAESHTVSYARYGDTFYMVTIGGRGINIWDVTTATAPKHIKAVPIAGTSYGDYTEAVWGVTWQGQYIYVGATNNGIKVVDAANPAAAVVVKEVPTSAFGGVSAGPLDAIGNTLVVTTPKESGGVATLDISDPVNPTKLGSFTTNKAYIGMFHRHYIFLIGLTAYDVLTNPKAIGPGNTPLGKLPTEGSEYMSFQDDYMFLGHVRTEIGGTPGASKIDVSDPRSMKVTSRIWGRLDFGGKNDDQFTIALGNLLVIGDDQSPYYGWFLAAHQAEPDTKAPLVDTVIPANMATAVSTKSRIGLTFSDNIELATVNASSFIVRPVGGQPLPGKYGVRMSVLNFDPDEDLKPATTYEVILPKGGVCDLAGNPIATEWKSLFTTN